MRFKHYLGFLFKQQLISLYVNDSGRGSELPEKCGNSDRKLKTEWRMGSFRSPCVVCSGNSSFVLAGAPSVLRPELPGHVGAADLMPSLASWGAKGPCKQHHCTSGTSGILLPSVAILP